MYGLGHVVLYPSDLVGVISFPSKSKDSCSFCTPCVYISITVSLASDKPTHFFTNLSNWPLPFPTHFLIQSRGGIPGSCCGIKHLSTIIIYTCQGGFMIQRFCKVFLEVGMWEFSFPPSVSSVLCRCSVSTA